VRRDLGETPRSLRRPDAAGVGASQAAGQAASWPLQARPPEQVFTQRTEKLWARNATDREHSNKGALGSATQPLERLRVEPLTPPAHVDEFKIKRLHPQFDGSRRSLQEVVESAEGEAWGVRDRGGNAHGPVRVAWGGVDQKRNAVGFPPANGGNGRQKSLHIAAPANEADQRCTCAVRSLLCMASLQHIQLVQSWSPEQQAQSACGERRSPVQIAARPSRRILRCQSEAGYPEWQS